MRDMHMRNALNAYRSDELDYESMLAVMQVIKNEVPIYDGYIITKAADYIQIRIFETVTKWKTYWNDYAVY